MLHYLSLIARVGAAVSIALTLFIARAAASRITCALPRIHPSTVLAGSLAGVPLSTGRPAIITSAVDAEGEVAWEVQDQPPAALFPFLHPKPHARLASAPGSLQDIP